MIGAAAVPLLLVGGGVIGLLLALLGAGGSILLLPLLVSGAALSTREAVPLSLLVVLLLALGNLGPYLARRQFALRPALILGLPALAGSWIGGCWVKAGHGSEPFQLGVFAVAALAASWWMLRPPPLAIREKTPSGPPPSGNSPRTAARALGPSLLLAAEGIGVGLLTGIAGVGGGFAIVPALVLLAGLSMPVASGTSLLLIALNALVAFAALGHWPSQGLPLLLPLVLGGALGAFLGQWLAPHLPEQGLRKGFAALLLGSALLSGSEAVQRSLASYGLAPSPPLPSPSQARHGLSNLPAPPAQQPRRA